MTNFRRFRAVTLVFAVGVGGGAGVLGGCAAGPGAGGEAARDKASRPITEVSERKAAEARRLAAEKARQGAPAASGTAEIPSGDKALDEWIQRAQADGLVKAEPSKVDKVAGKPTAKPPARQAAKGSGATAGIAANSPTEVPAPAVSDENISDGEPGNGKSDGSAATNVPVNVDEPEKKVLATVAPSDQAAIMSSIAGSQPLSALVKLNAAKAAGDPNVSNTDIAALEKSLSPQEAEFYTAWKSLLTSVSAGAGTSADVAAMKRAASQFAQATRGWAELRLPKALLCTRVEGFGMYNELRRANGGVMNGTLAGGKGGADATGRGGMEAGGAVLGAGRGGVEDNAYTFLAGRKNKFIVYCEIDGFASRPSSSSGRAGFDVELAQDLTLFASGSGRDVVAWRKPDQRVRDFSRNQRRDFFMVQIVELPETLSVGGYLLKVRIKDLASGDGSEAEAVIPIDIVADASAMR